MMMITKQAACEENVFNAQENAVTSFFSLSLLKSENEQIIGLTKAFLSENPRTSNRIFLFSFQH